MTLGFRVQGYGAIGPWVSGLGIRIGKVISGGGGYPTLSYGACS